MERNECFPSLSALRFLRASLILLTSDAGWSSPVARQAHNLEVAGSNPVPATIRLRS